MTATILTFLGHYLPGFRAGGPIKTMAGLIDHLGQEYRFRILTSDRDLGMHCGYGDIVPNRWHERGGAEVCYLSPERRSFRAITKLLSETPHDLVYLNSLHAKTWAILPLVLRRFGRIQAPTLLGPRGELSAGALSLKRRRKELYRGFGKAVGLFDNLHWQASSKDEAKDIVDYFEVPEENLHVARDLAPAHSVPFERQVRLPGQPLRMLFLSRVSPMKNLDGALSMLAEVRSPVRFDIVGTEEDRGYVARCRAIAASLPPHIEVQWLGPVAPAEVRKVMAQYDLFFFPTHGENFGHVIAEALSAGTPLLISDTTPWRDLARHGAGHEFPLDDKYAFVKVIEDMASWTPNRHLDASEATLRLARQLLDPRPDIAANRAMFEKVLAA